MSGQGYVYDPYGQNRAPAPQQGYPQGQGVPPQQNMQPYQQQGYQQQGGQMQNMMQGFSQGANNFMNPTPQQSIAPVTNYNINAGAQNQRLTGDFSFLQGTKRILLKQRFEAIEALANTVGFDAVEFANKYDFYDADSGQRILYAYEESNCCIRVLCKPNHPAKLRVFDGRQGVADNTLLYTMEKPFKLNCFTCCNICAQSQESFAGEGGEGARLLGSAKKRKCWNSILTPIVDLKEANSETNFLTVKGPICVVGGLIELCMDQQFNFVKGDEEKGRIVKMKPQGGMNMAQEAVGDADTFLLELNDAYSAEQIANVLGTLLMLDYLFFEGGPPVSLENGGLSFNCFTVYCCGCVCPCNCGPGNASGSGGGFGDEGGFSADF